MRLGQISWTNFVSKLSASVIGFFATLYIARHLGAAPLGTYHLSIGLVSWLAIAGNVGFSRALSKRVSEGNERGQYAAAGITTIGILFVILGSLVLIFRSQVNSYVGYPVAIYIVIFLLVVLSFGVISSLLVGLNLVHINGVLSTIKTGSRGTFQILLVSVGVSTVGLFIGHILGTFLVIVIGGYIVYKSLPEVSRPSKRHFVSLIDFAKYSWLGGLRGRMFNYTDVIVLGIFVSQTLIGIYSVAWNIAQFLLIFSSSIQSTLFPELSKLSAEGDTRRISRLVEQSITFAGLFHIPGIFGGAILADRILRIYGTEFQAGTTILILLIIATLIEGYQKQFLNALNGIDRPNLAFKVNGVFVGANLLLNLFLIYVYGWIGAAVATVASAGFGLCLGYYYLSRVIAFDVPVMEIAKQGMAACIMAGVIYALLRVEIFHRLIDYNFVIVLTLVIVGAGIYFLILLVLSTEFRDTVNRNVPFNL